MPADGGLRVDLPGRAALAVFSVNGTTFVFDDLCTHGDASLADGEVQGVEIICPYHMGSFDMRTGEPMAAPCSVAINVYPSEVRDGVVYAQLPAV
jgi:nitrite reductase/ring-hydroxylating ferredoxin subunit